MKTVLAIALTMVSIGAAAQVPVSGYVKKDGTYVPPTVRSAPNNTQMDNYSTKGNTNPYNGNEGTVQPQPATSYYTPPPPVVHQPQSRQSGYQPMKPVKINPNGF